jgi:hypothetical protein
MTFDLLCFILFTIFPKISWLSHVYAEILYLLNAVTMGSEPHELVITDHEIIF